MRARVDPDLCTGCEACVNLCPDLFEMKGNVAVMKVDPIPSTDQRCCRHAAHICPVNAISVIEPGLTDIVP